MATRQELEDLARFYATSAGIDPNIFVRQINRESGFDPNAYNRRSGASGIAQIVPRWHPGVNPYDPGAALQYAANLMAKYVRQFGDYTKALAAYNAGPNGDWSNAETTAYVNDILQGGTGENPQTVTEQPQPVASGTDQNKGCVTFASSTALLGVALGYSIPLIVVIVWHWISG